MPLRPELSPPLRVLVICLSLLSGLHRSASARQPLSERPLAASNQRAAIVGKLGTTYAIYLESRSYSLTVHRITYVATRLLFNGRTIYPDADQKFLVVDYSVANLSHSADLALADIEAVMTAVDARGDAYKLSTGTEDVHTRQRPPVALAPGGRIECLTYFVLQASERIRSLTLALDGRRSVHFDLSRNAKRVEPIVADPADKTGQSSLSVIRDAQIDFSYPCGPFDIALEKIEMSDLPIGGISPDPDCRYIIATVRFKNALSALEADVDASNPGNTSFAIITTSGSKSHWTGDFWETQSEARAQTKIPAGFEKHFRLYFNVPSSSRPESLTLSEGEKYRKLVYNVNGKQ